MVSLMMHYMCFIQEEGEDVYLDTYESGDEEEEEDEKGHNSHLEDQETDCVDQLVV